MRSGTKVVLVALVAGTLGALASLATTGPGPLLRTDAGQRLLGRWFAATAPAVPQGVVVAERGAVVPALQLRTLEGREVRIPSDFAGRPLLVNVWASWCGPCIEEMPELQRFAVAQGPGGTQVVGVALDDADAVRAFLARVPVDYPVLLDAPGPADAGVRLGNPKGVLPYSVLVSADGRLLRQRIGPFAAGEITRWAAANSPD
jgi:thiol-disulfide isomerase/thioredoxin